MAFEEALKAQLFNINQDTHVNGNEMKDEEEEEEGFIFSHILEEMEELDDYPDDIQHI